MQKKSYRDCLFLDISSRNLFAFGTPPFVPHFSSEVHGIMGVVGTLGTADASGTSQILSIGVDPTTGAMFTNNIGGASGYTEGTTVGTATGNAIVFRGTGGTIVAVGTQNPLPVQEQFAPLYEDNINQVAAVLMKPGSSSLYAPSLYTNLGGSLTALVKGTIGNIYSVHFTNLGTTIVYLQFHNLGSVAPIGSIPLYSFPIEGGTTTRIFDNTFFSPSHNFTTGISAGIGTAVGTLGTTGLTAANYVWHVHYV